MNSEEGWSFCIITGGTADDLIQKSVAKIEKEFSSDFEILIVGGNFSSVKGKSVRHIAFSEEGIPFLSVLKRRILEFDFRKLKKTELRYTEKRGWITRKKNLAAKFAKYNKLCIVHDYVSIEEGFKKAFEEFGESWEVVVPKVLNFDGSRHCDWTAWDYPAIGPGLIPYNSYTKYMYISGAVLCVKRDFFLKHPLDERLFWGDGEDVEWSIRVRELTRFRMNPKASVRYLKLKPFTDPPYCENWVKNAELLEKVLTESP